MISNIFKEILYCLPPKTFNNLRYFKEFRKILDIRDPQTLNEKLNWKKLYDHNPLYTKCADKYAVREYIKEKIGEKYLIPLLYHTDKPEEIPFDKLKPPYIIKPNQCSGYTIIILDKKEVDRKNIIQETNKWLKINYYKYSKEWQYRDIKPKVLVEQLLLDDKKRVPSDYKFHCFNGKVEFVGVHSSRFSNHKLTYFDKNWKLMPFIWCKKKKKGPAYSSENDLPKPKNLKEMVKIAEILSHDFDFVRVDLYVIKNRIYFGELTFYPGGGCSLFFPDKYDLIYGKKLKLKSFKKR